MPEGRVVKLFSYKYMIIIEELWGKELNEQRRESAKSLEHVRWKGCDIICVKLNERKSLKKEVCE